MHRFWIAVFAACMAAGSHADSASRVLAAEAASAEAAARPAPAVDFHRDIRPIFEQKCLRCHKPGKLDGGLDLSTREALLKGGDSGPALVPGNTEKSLMLELVEFDEMPPRKEQPRVTKDEFERLRAWIEAGAAVPALAQAAAAAGDRAPAEPQVLRAGMIGLDTSHVPAFTRIFNSPRAEGDLAGIRVVAGYPGGTDIPASRDRVEGFTEQLRGMGVEIVETIPELLEKVDVVLLESVDGRIHLEEAIPVIQAGKPLFIDKPLAGSLADAVAIVELARKRDVPLFSSSSLRFYPGLQALLNNDEVGEIAGAATWGPCSYQAGTPDMFFYGIHGIEALFTLMGPGCQTVTRIQTRDTDLVAGTWAGGRVGTYRGIRRNRADSGAIAFGSKAIKTAERGGGYEPLCREIARFFKTGQPPVSPETTLEIFAFMEAADESKRRGGAPVSIAETLEAARAEAAARLAELTN